MTEEKRGGPWRSHTRRHRRKVSTSPCLRRRYRERSFREDRRHRSHVVVVTRETRVSRSVRRMTRRANGFLHGLEVAGEGQWIGMIERFHDFGFRVERMTRQTAFVVQQAEMNRMGEARGRPFMGHRTCGRPMNASLLTALCIDTVALQALPGGFGVR